MLQVAWASFRTHLQVTLTRPLFRVMMVIQPVAIVSFAQIIYGSRPNLGFFVMFGAGLASVWAAAAFSSAGDLGRERRQGTLVPVFVASAPLLVVSASRAMASLVLSLVPFCLTVAMSLLFGQRVPSSASLLGLGLSFVAFALGAHAMGLALSALFLASRRSLVLQNLLEWPVILASGVLAPIALMPVWVETVSRVLPTRWGAEAAFAAFQLGEIKVDALGFAIALTAVYAVSAHVLYGYIEFRVRLSGSLEIA
ncbi:MAG: ABC transporter permease [Acidimicrobiales bacterium]